MADQTWDKSSSGFDHYLVSVAERDIDLLLMEEFHASDTFVTWFCRCLGLADVRRIGAWHSVSDSDGETDLLLRVEADGRRVAVLIENKISALEQHEQPQRYHIRAARDQQQGRCDAYVIVICAPERYLAGLNAQSDYQYQVSYEQIAAWFSRQPDRRSAWRRQVIEHAIEQARRGYQLVLHPAHTAFHVAYYEIVRSNYPDLVMRPVKGRGSGSTWIVLKGRHFPKHDVQIDHKLTDGIVRLSFFKRGLAELRELHIDWPKDVRLTALPKSVTADIVVARINPEQPLENQREAVEQALQAAQRLVPFGTVFI
ncbi:MAG: PD-(D/E)XK nuclease family protein [Paraburkholderia fungorum]|nr:PD-(D/E)XK nuclease family protein [Paraburkholderia fungorum]